MKHLLVSTGEQIRPNSLIAHIRCIPKVVFFFFFFFFVVKVIVISCFRADESPLLNQRKFHPCWKRCNGVGKIHSSHFRFKHAFFP